MGNQGGYPAPGGNQLSVGSVYGKTPTQTPAWGGPNLRWGDTNPGVNAGYASQAMPGTPAGYQQGFAATAGTPWSSNPNQYGRWNWAAQMPQQPQQPGQPQQPYQPPQGQPQQPQQPYQPAPYQPAPQQPAPQQPQQNASARLQAQLAALPNGGRGATPTAINPYAGGNGNVTYSQAAVDQGLTTGDIWQNPLFANMIANNHGGGSGIFG